MLGSGGDGLAPAGNAKLVGIGAKISRTTVMSLEDGGTGSIDIALQVRLV